MKNLRRFPRTIRFFTKDYHYDSFLPHIVGKVVSAAAGQIISHNEARQIAASGRVKLDGQTVQGVDFVVPEGTHEFMIEPDVHGGGYRTPYSFRVYVSNVFLDA